MRLVPSCSRACFYVPYAAPSKVHAGASGTSPSSERGDFQPFVSLHSVEIGSERNCQFVRL